MAYVEYFCPSCDRRIQNPREVEELTCLSCKKSVQLIKKGISKEAALRSRRRAPTGSGGSGMSPFATRIFRRQATLFPLLGFIGLAYAGYEWFADPASEMNHLVVIGISLAFVFYGGMLFFVCKSRTKFGRYN